ncbi:MAG: DEAD/DEAH box helicase family protein [Legionellales bacterium]|nr:DEAD/DEAH box helicase family protein [Legionellales bacterium]
MRLGPQQKQRLIGNAERVYLGYLALDFSKTKAVIYTTQTDAFSVMDLYQIMLRDRKPSMDITIAGKQYQAKLSQNSWGEYELTLGQPVITSPAQAVPVQALGQYTDDQVANLFTKQPFKIEMSRDGKVDVSLRLEDGDRQFTIGGRGKYDLYRTHLISLSNIIKKLKTEDNLSALLVALATGTGKTFVQALWMEVLYLTEVTGIFGVPDELIPQFVADMHKLLPDELVDQIKTLRKADTYETKLAAHKLNHLKDEPGSLIVADSFRLLDQHHKALLEAPSDTTFLSVDEQHLLMSNERRRKRLLELPNRLLSMFLTATPDKETFELSGERPVASMSNRQKEQAGQGRLPKFETIQVPFFGDLNRRHTTNWWQWMKNVITIHVPNMLFPEVSSAAQFAIERLPFHFHYDVEPGQSDLGPRWNLHSAAARKTLVVVDDNETLVNFMHYLHENPTGSGYQHIAGRAPELGRISRPSTTTAPPVYSRGAFEPNGVQEHMRNIGDGSSVFGKAARGGFRPEALEALQQSEERLPLWGAHELIAKERAAVWDAASAQLPDAQTKARMKDMVDGGLVAQMHSNMFHYLVEYVLSDLTGLDQITLNKMRKENLDGLLALVERKYSETSREKTATYYEEKLQTKIDAAGAEQISTLLAGLHQCFGQGLSERKKAFVDNWFLDQTLMTEMTAGASEYGYDYNDDSSSSYQRWSSSATKPAPKTDYEKFGSNFKRYANKYLVMGVMTGMADSETQVADSRPFTGLKKHTQAIFDEHGRFTQHAKQRQRHSIQILIGRGNEDVFEPKYYEGLTEEQADNYFRLGFIGTYVSNKKQKGFSDLNLHTVLNLAEQTVNPNNSPEITIQASGRNRGLDETVVPSYIHVLGNKQTTNFDPKLLNRDDYYTDFFRAQGEYNEQCIDLLGINLAKRIRELYFKYKNTEDASIDATSLHAEITEEIALYLRDINNRNSHNIGLSRKQLTRVVAKAMAVLEDDIKGLRNPYKLSPSLVFIVKSAISSAQAFFYAFNFVQTRKIQDQLKQHQASLSSAPRSLNDRLYLKLTRQKPALNMFVLRNLSQQLSAQAERMVREIKKAQAIRLPREVESDIEHIEQQASLYGYPVQRLLEILNATPVERARTLTSVEKTYLLPRLIGFEKLLDTHQVSKERLGQYVAARPQAREQKTNTRSFEQVMGELVQLLQQGDASRHVMGQIGLGEDTTHTIMRMISSQPFRDLGRVFETIRQDECVAMLKTQSYNAHAADAGAKRVLAFVEIIKTQDQARFQKEFLELPAVSSAAAGTAALPLFELVKDCSACGKALLKSHEYFTQSRFDKTYIKIVRQTHLTDLISMVVPGVELLAWLRKKAPTVRTALFDHMVAKGTTEEERLQIKENLMMALNQMQAADRKRKPMPRSVDVAVKAFEEKARHVGYNRTLLEVLRLSAEDRRALPAELNQPLCDIERQLDFQDDFSREELQENLARGPNMADAFPAELKAPMTLFQMAMGENPEDHKALGDLLADHIAPIIFHSQIAESLRLFVGKLNHDDIRALFEANDHPDPASAADHILTLVDIVNNQDLPRFVREFLLPKPGRDGNVDEMQGPAMPQLFGEVMLFGKTVVDCSEHFTRTDLQGSESTSDVVSENKFVQSISDRLRDIRMPHRKFANRVEQGKGFIKGLTNLAKISGDANGDDIRFLTRIKNHILRPIWWTASLSKWAFSFVETAKNVVFWFRDLGFTIWNKLSQFSAWMHGKLDSFRPSKKSAISAEYNAETFKAVRAMNDLKPLTVAEVASLECPDDTIVKFERSAASRRRGSAFFVPAPVSSTTAPPGQTAAKRVIPSSEGSSTSVCRRV